MKLDIFKYVSQKHTFSTYIGLCFSFLFLLLFFSLIIYQISLLTSPKIESFLLIDHLKDDDDLTVSIDIMFERFPCGLIFLNKSDVLHTKEIDIEENIRKYTLDKNGFIKTVNPPLKDKSFEERLAIIKKQAEEGEGCNIIGEFSIKMVPGNFSFSFNKYWEELRYLLKNEILIPDISYIIKRLDFGDLKYREKQRIRNDFKLKSLSTLRNASNMNMLKNYGFPHYTINNIRIIPSKFEYDEGETYEYYQYTAVKKNYSGHKFGVSFDFEIENFYMHFKMDKRHFISVFIKILALLGAIFTLLGFLKEFFEEGMSSLYFKRRIGKIE